MKDQSADVVYCVAPHAPHGGGGVARNPDGHAPCSGGGGGCGGTGGAPAGGGGGRLVKVTRFEMGGYAFHGGGGTA
jgi:hypothetical protein